MKTIFETRISNEYAQRISDIEGIYAIMTDHANTPERKREAKEWLEKRIAGLDEWYRSRLGVGS